MRSWPQEFSGIYFGRTNTEQIVLVQHRLEASESVNFCSAIPAPHPFPIHLFAALPKISRGEMRLHDGAKMEASGDLEMKYGGPEGPRIPRYN